MVGYEGEFSGGTKHDKGKPRVDLIPPGAILEVAGVLTDGVEEYSAHNWRRGIAYSRLYAAIQRHLLAFWKGGDIDKSGHRALAHACTDIMMLMEMPPEWDDRYKPETHVAKYKPDTEAITKQMLCEDNRNIMGIIIPIDIVNTHWETERKNK